MIDWSQYAVGGAASRPDSFTRLDPQYAASIAELLMAAEEELGPGSLRITSAYRSPELQAVLYEDAIKKYGSPEAARKWVAPPGRSMHNIGLAVDFADASGSLLRDPDSPEARWIAENAPRFGLTVPMSWEPWQVEPEGYREGTYRPSGGGEFPTKAAAALSAAGETAPEQGRGNSLQRFGEAVTAFEVLQNGSDYCPVGTVYDAATDSCIPVESLTVRQSEPSAGRGAALQRFGISSLI